MAQHLNAHHVTARISRALCLHADLFQNLQDLQGKLQLNLQVHHPVAVVLLPTVLPAGLDKII